MVGKKQSKRQTLHKKHKIDKKCRQHKKKLRREARKAKKLGISKTTKKKEKIKIPSLWPHKEAELQNIENMKSKQEEETKLRREAQKAEKKREQKKTRKEANAKKARPEASFSEIIQDADLIIEVLDARDPRVCRCAELEKYGKAPKVLVLTKCDKVTMEHLDAWLAYLRKELPVGCIAFQEGKKPVCMNTLTKLIKGFTFKTCAVVGYSKVTDKSRLCQMLRNSSWANARKFTELTLEGDNSDLCLLDRPQSADTGIQIIDRLLQRASQEDIRLSLNLPRFLNAHDLLSYVQKEKNVGLVDAARIILKNFTSKDFEAKVPEENAPIQADVIQPKIDDLNALYVEERKFLKTAVEEQQRLSRPLSLSVDTLFGPESPSLDQIGVFDEMFSAKLENFCEKDADMESDDMDDDDDEDMDDDGDEEEDSEAGSNDEDEEENGMNVDDGEENKKNIKEEGNAKKKENPE